MEFKKLFAPIYIGAMRLKNRLVMSPMGTNYADNRGMVTPRQLAYYAERAKGGVGMITTEVTSISSNTLDGLENLSQGTGYIKQAMDNLADIGKENEDNILLLDQELSGIQQE